MQHEEEMLYLEETLDYEFTNRENAMRAKRGRHWCMSCDSQLVGQYGKCPVCGKYANKKKRKGI